jgi:hypothetical protein
MEPKLKAIELFDKYCLELKTEGNEFGYYTNTIQAKKCALIAVNEILEHCYEVMKPFWQEVKQEIEKL